MERILEAKKAKQFSQMYDKIVSELIDYGMRV